MRADITMMSNISGAPGGVEIHQSERARVVRGETDHICRDRQSVLAASGNPCEPSTLSLDEG